MKTPLRLLVVDDHSLFRRGLIALLSQHENLSVVGEAGDAGEAQRLVAALQPDVLLLDNHLPGVRGVDALPALREAAPQTRVLMLTVSENEADLAQALHAGAQGYLLKTIDGDALLAAIEACARGESVISPELTGKLVTALQSALRPAPAETQSPADPLDALSPRERDTLREIARGASNKEIARTLEIAETTVKIHVQHILRKLNLSSRVQAAVFASERGLVPAER
ncbi:response regulator [Roseateles toxinivorans]|uniref:LuxR family two component transcriptional regulator n=1 Tax=Roseateles toxinivorans TaxID=270368 RepID=A0A4R6QID0_9BURK|nr:response regulator transcription factor [Roseateles toxinivorans]TDP62267.1 LuxR family two component transcriptional regulator [Roseateles toxinivorans]